ncbi:FitA-like ribbon-helix-helix domain-containing protein [Arthrobacter sp. H14]|uniref:FitA-like ribbon-helix-helix domain-containing protein n=1 Tax=Arthrobacter sp. H14 TaxID=1312959 RepID=UPI000685D7FB
MGSVTIRNVDDELKQQIRLRAATNGNSMEAEIRVALRNAFFTQGYAYGASKRVRRGEEPGWVKSWMQSCLAIGSMEDVRILPRTHDHRSTAGWAR